MNALFLGLTVVLFLLAVFDLFVGVSNDAVNFLNSAIGTKSAKFRTILIVAAVGIFLGAATSNGMMDIARHGIFHPEHFSFYSIMCIFMAVMVTDIILLDVFNSLALPTSTTVSMVFELLGATFVTSLMMMHADPGSGLTLGDLVNTDKALEVIIGIFLSVAIAFVVGTVVQWIARMFFSFARRGQTRLKVALFGGVAVMAIVYFLLIKGFKTAAFMTPEFKDFLTSYVWYINAGVFAVSAVLMYVLQLARVNVFRIIVLMGTFALAMAFAGNDLVNFIGVPLSGFAAYQDFVASGSGDVHGFLMDSLNGPARTPIYFLLAAGLIMVVSLATSSKARRVSRTEVGLGSQGMVDEMFESSRIARRLVRWSLGIIKFCRRHTPERLRRWMNSRFNTGELELEEGAAFDMVRGSVNLVVAGLLIAVGTSLKLPLSTTFVTFMVAMGTSLADRAWSRESAVFRVTGVITVIGGWFITAGVAFIGAGLMVLMMNAGGPVVILALTAVAIFVLVRSNIRARRDSRPEGETDELFGRISALKDKDRDEVWPLLREYILRQQDDFLSVAGGTYLRVTNGFAKYETRPLFEAEHTLAEEKKLLKSRRRKETYCLRKADHSTATENSTWFHSSNNALMAMMYNLRHINDACLEHVDNNFQPLDSRFAAQMEVWRVNVLSLLARSREALAAHDDSKLIAVRESCEWLKGELSREMKQVYGEIRDTGSENVNVAYVYLNYVQETQEFVSGLRRMLRSDLKMLFGVDCTTVPADEREQD